MPTSAENPIRRVRPRVTRGTAGAIVSPESWYAICDLCDGRVETRHGGATTDAVRLFGTRPQTRKQAKDALHSHRMKRHVDLAGRVDNGT